VRTVELILAFAGALICTGVAALFASSQASSGADLWPLPGLVFLEVIILGLLGLTAAASQPGDRHSAWAYVPWAVTGGLAALVVLGGFTIGPYLLPAAVCFLVASMIGAKRWNARPLTGIGLAALAAILQAMALFLPILLTGQT
jgi:hypothetical protein